MRGRYARQPTQSTEQLIPAAIEAFWGTIPPVWNRIKGNVRSIAVENYDISVEQFHILRHIRKGLTSVSELAAGETDQPLGHQPGGGCAGGTRIDLPPAECPGPPEHPA